VDLVYQSEVTHAVGQQGRHSLTPPSHPYRASLFSIAKTLATTALVVTSLLTFPSSIPWMIGTWLLWHTVRVVQGHAGWLPLVTCAVIVAAKRTPLPPALIGLGLVAVGVGILAVLRARTATPVRWWNSARLCSGCLWVTWAGMAFDWHAAAHSNREVSYDVQRPVVCLGDSLTSVSPPKQGYPARLQDLLAAPVVNLGRPGITTGEALRQLPALVAARPQVVVIELGGHDYLRGLSRETARANLETIIRASLAFDAEVVLMEIPRGFITDPFAGLERELARKYDLELISDTPIRKLVLFSPHAPPGMWTGGPHLSDDGLHPNAAGDHVLAQAVAYALVRIYGSSILATESK